METTITAREESRNRLAGSSRYVRITILTNRPEAVVVGPMGPQKAVPQGEIHRVHGSTHYRWEAKVQIAEELLGDEGFVACLLHDTRDHCGTRYMEGLEPLAGWPVTEEYLFFGSAYALWAEEKEREAYAFLEGLAAGKTRKTHHALEFAAGYGCGFQPHSQRRAAWEAVLRGLGFHGDVAPVVKSVRTATVKAALRLGWQPSEPAPAFWEGLPQGVVELTPAEV